MLYSSRTVLIIVYRSANWPPVTVKVFTHTAENLHVHKELKQCYIIDYWGVYDVTPAVFAVVLVLCLHGDHSMFAFGQPRRGAAVTSLPACSHINLYLVVVICGQKFIKSFDNLHVKPRRHRRPDK